jgi:hypothetical protein
MLVSTASPAASARPAPRVLDQLTPENSVVVLIDFQPQYTFSTRSTDITWLPVMLEWQSDWSHGETSGAVNQIIREHAASMSAGAQYRQAMRPVERSAAKEAP